MKLKYWLAGVLFLATIAVNAQERRKIEFVEYDLPNGLHVILHEDHSTPVVAVTLSYHVGSKNEKIGRTGFAHFFEHLMFEGTQHIDRHQFDKFVESAGGTLNANTSQDRTFYYELLPSNQLELGIWLESERLLHAKVENIGIETQREVVKEEKRQRIDNQPYGSWMEEIFKRAYVEHPYRWVPIGSMEDLNAAQEEDYVNFYRTFYVPHNATLSIAGDINVEQAKKWIAAYFGTIPNGEKLDIYRDKEFLTLEQFQAKYAAQLKGRETSKDFIGDFERDLSTEDFIKKYFPNASEKPRPIPTPEIKEGMLKAEILDTIYDNIQIPAVFIAYRTPELNHPDRYAVDMLSMILSDGNSSRLNKNLVEKNQALFAFSFPFPLEDPGIAVMLASPAGDVTPKGLQDAIDAEVAKLQNELITDEEFGKLKNMIESDFILSNSTMAGIAESLSDYYTFHKKNTNLINTELDNYMAVTKADIQRVAKTYFVKSNRVILYYLPKEG